MEFTIWSIILLLFVNWVVHILNTIKFIINIYTHFGGKAVIKHSKYNSQSSEFCPELALMSTCSKKNIVCVCVQKDFLICYLLHLYVKPDMPRFERPPKNNPPESRVKAKRQGSFIAGSNPVLRALVASDAKRPRARILQLLL